MLKMKSTIYKCYLGKCSIRKSRSYIVTDYLAGSPVEEKIEFLKSHPALKNVDAIKNNKIYVVGLADLSPGVRNPKVIEKMYGYFYGENK